MWELMIFMAGKLQGLHLGAVAALVLCMFRPLCNAAWKLTHLVYVQYPPKNKYQGTCPYMSWLVIVVCRSVGVICLLPCLRCRSAA